MSLRTHGLVAEGVPHASLSMLKLRYNAALRGLIKRQMIGMGPFSHRSQRSSRTSPKAENSWSGVSRTKRKNLQPLPGLSVKRCPSRLPGLARFWVSQAKSSKKGSVLDIVYSPPSFLRRYKRWFRYSRVPIARRSAIHPTVIVVSARTRAAKTNFTESP